MVKLKQKKWWIVPQGIGTLLAFFLWDVSCSRHSNEVKVQVYLFQKGNVTAVSTNQKTVGDVLKDQGIHLKPQDEVVPDLSTPVTQGMEIDLGLVDRKVTTVKRKIPVIVHTDYTDTLNVGEIIDLEPGQEGEEEVQTESYYLNG